LWQVARRHTRLTAFIILLAATLGVLDLYLGWRWRQTVPTLSKDLREMPWWWTPYCGLILWAGLVASFISGLPAVLASVASRRRWLRPRRADSTLGLRRKAGRRSRASDARPCVDCIPGKRA